MIWWMRIISNHYLSYQTWVKFITVRTAEQVTKKLRLTQFQVMLVWKQSGWYSSIENTWRWVHTVYFYVKSTSKKVSANKWKQGAFDKKFEDSPYPLTSEALWESSIYVGSRCSFTERIFARIFQPDEIYSKIYDS